MNKNLDYFIDAKILGITFDFDAANFMKPQSLIIFVENLFDKVEKFKVCFQNVSSFSFHIDIGEKILFPNNYQADSLYIQSIELLNSDKKHQYWQIKLIENFGCIDVFCDDVIFDKIDIRG